MFLSVIPTCIFCTRCRRQLQKRFFLISIKILLKKIITRYKFRFSNAPMLYMLFKLINNIVYYYMHRYILRRAVWLKQYELSRSRKYASRAVVLWLWREVSEEKISEKRSTPLISTRTFWHYLVFSNAQRAVIVRSSLNRRLSLIGSYINSNLVNI